MSTTTKKNPLKITSKLIADINFMICNPKSGEFFKNEMVPLVRSKGLVTDNRPDGKTVQGKSLYRSEFTFALKCPEFEDAVEISGSILSTAMELVTDDYLGQGLKVTHMNSLPEYEQIGNPFFKCVARRSKDWIEASFICEAYVDLKEE